ncbi:MAG: phenylalanine--tRNA ligase subunit alpha, partial [Actinomycetota bacterium]|nr:phenylalanine--tRNA ligase subunit alpha [Actinomycetota bacterium]
MDYDALPQLQDEGLTRVSAAATLAELHEAEADLVGRSSVLADLQKRLGTLPPEERRAAGQSLNATRGRLTDAFRERRRVLEEQARAGELEADRLDLTEIPYRPRRGHLHLVTQTRQELEDVFVGMGYGVAEGPEVETDWHN